MYGHAGSSPAMPRLVKRPSLEEILDFCAREPIERVFLEDVARRGPGRSPRCGTEGISSPSAISGEPRPFGRRDGGFREDRRALPAAHADRRRARGHRPLEAARDHLPGVREDRPGQPVYVLDEEPAAGDSALRTATSTTSTSSSAPRRRPFSRRWASTPMPATRRSSSGEPGHRSRRAAAGSEEDGTVLFKAEASAWTARSSCSRSGSTLRARQGLRETRPRRPLPPSARAHSVRLPLRAPRERARSPSTTRSACAGRRLPLAHLRVVAIAT